MTIDKNLSDNVQSIHDSVQSIHDSFDRISKQFVLNRKHVTKCAILSVIVIFLAVGILAYGIPYMAYLKYHNSKPFIESQKLDKDINDKIDRIIGKL